jgi:hypothetical protein
MHGSPQIHENFYFDPKIHFVNFSVFKLERGESFMGNCERKKMIGCLIPTTKMITFGVEKRSLMVVAFFLKVLIRGVTQARAHGLTYFFI